MILFIFCWHILRSNLYCCHPWNKPFRTCYVATTVCGCHFVNSMLVVDPSLHFLPHVANCLHIYFSKCSSHWLIPNRYSCKPNVNFTSILRVAFVLIFLCQNSTILYEKAAWKLKVRLTPILIEQLYHFRPVLVFNGKKLEFTKSER